MFTWFEGEILSLHVGKLDRQTFQTQDTPKSIKNM